MALQRLAPGNSYPLSTSFQTSGLPTFWAVKTAVIQCPCGWHLRYSLTADLAYNGLLHGVQPSTWKSWKGPLSSSLKINNKDWRIDVSLHSGEKIKRFSCIVLLVMAKRSKHVTLNLVSIQLSIQLSRIVNRRFFSGHALPTTEVVLAPTANHSDLSLEARRKTSKDA